MFLYDIYNMLGWEVVIETKIIIAKTIITLFLFFIIKFFIKTSFRFRLILSCRSDK